MCAFMCGPPERVGLCDWLAVHDVITRSLVSLVVTSLSLCVAGCDWQSGRAGGGLSCDPAGRCITLS